MCIIVFTATAKPVLEVLIVAVAFRGRLASHVTLLPGLRVDAQSAGCVLGHPRRTAVADKVPLVEKLNKGVFTVAGYRARVADACWSVDLGGARRRWAACETCVKALTKWTEIARTCVELLSIISMLRVTGTGC